MNPGGAWISSEQVYNMRKAWEGRQKEACQTYIYTRNFITAIKAQVRGIAQTYLMHIKTNTRWLKIFNGPCTTKNYILSRGLPGSYEELWPLQIPGPRASSFFRLGPAKPKMKRYKSKTAWPEREPGLLGVHTLYQAKGLYVSSLYFPIAHQISWPTPSTEGIIMNTKTEDHLWR